jgi:ABC-type uncharacterized transport system permease subunit
MTVSNLLTSSVLRIEKRPRTGFLGQILAIVIALTASLAVSALLIRIAGADVEEAFVALYKGAFGSRRAIIETLVRAAPLILTGLSATLAFRAYIWNIGIEGQLFAGAMAAYWVYTVLGWLPPVPLFLLIVLSGFVGGAIWGWIPGLLQNRFNVDIIISTVMSNYIATYLLSYMLSGAGPWREPGSYYQQSGQLAESAHYPLLIPDTRLHMGFAIGLIAAVSIYILLQRTPLGYEIRAVGSNPLASRFKGANLSKILIIVMLVSGGLAGLAGAGELFGVQHRLRLDISPGYGFTGMLVAMLAGLNPLIVIVVAIFFGSLNNGAIQMQIVTHVPTALADAIQAIVLLFLLSAQTIARYRIRRIRSDE